MTYHVQFSADGSVPLPSELVRELGLEPGDPLSVVRSESGITIRREDARDAAIARLRKALTGYSVDQFLSERRADWGE